MEQTTYLSVGYFQANVAWEDPHANLLQLKHRLESLQSVPELIVLPEMYTTGFSMNTEKAETAEGVSIKSIQQLALRFNTAICGSFMIKENASSYNRFYCITKDGVLASYNKKHLFTPGNENQHFTPGDHPLVFSYKGWKIMATICYDIRFPVWCRNSQNYHLLLNVANWPAARTHVWQTLLQARAIENQCYVLAVNRVGKDENKIEYIGGSCIINARGEYVLKSDDNEDFQITILDQKKLMDFRQNFPVLKDADPFQLI